MAVRMFMHNVYFTLHDNSPEGKQKLMTACGKYLTGHPGTILFAAGTRAEDCQRPVNDQAFDVSLHLFFQDKKSHDDYQEAPRHQQFVEENKASWKQVRVFDSIVGD
jgi:hypothetical protein